MSRPHSQPSVIFSESFFPCYLNISQHFYPSDQFPRRPPLSSHWFDSIVVPHPFVDGHQGRPGLYLYPLTLIDSLIAWWIDFSTIVLSIFVHLWYLLSHISHPYTSPAFYQSHYARLFKRPISTGPHSKLHLLVLCCCFCYFFVIPCHAKLTLTASPFSSYDTEAFVYGSFSPPDRNYISYTSIALSFGDSKSNETTAISALISFSYKAIEYGTATLDFSRHSNSLIPMHAVVQWQAPPPSSAYSLAVAISITPGQFPIDLTPPTTVGGIFAIFQGNSEQIIGHFDNAADPAFSANYSTFLTRALVNSFLFFSFCDDFKCSRAKQFHFLASEVVFSPPHILDSSNETSSLALPFSSSPSLSPISPSLNSSSSFDTDQTSTDNPFVIGLMFDNIDSSSELPNIVSCHINGFPTPLYRVVETTSLTDRQALYYFPTDSLALEYRASYDVLCQGIDLHFVSGYYEQNIIVSFISFRLGDIADLPAQPNNLFVQHSFVGPSVFIDFNSPVTIAVVRSVPPPPAAAVQASNSLHDIAPIYPIMTTHDDIVFNHDRDVVELSDEFIWDMVVLHTGCRIRIHEPVNPRDCIDVCIEQEINSTNVKFPLNFDKITVLLSQMVYGSDNEVITHWAEYFHLDPIQPSTDFLFGKQNCYRACPFENLVPNDNTAILVGTINLTLTGELYVPRYAAHHTAAEATTQNVSTDPLENMPWYTLYASISHHYSDFQHFGVIAPFSSRPAVHPSASIAQNMSVSSKYDHNNRHNGATYAAPFSITLDGVLSDIYVFDIVAEGGISVMPLYSNESSSIFPTTPIECRLTNTQTPNAPSTPLYASVFQYPTHDNPLSPQLSSPSSPTPLPSNSFTNLYSLQLLNILRFFPNEKLVPQYDSPIMKTSNSYIITCAGNIFIQAHAFAPFCDKHSFTLRHALSLSQEHNILDATNSPIDPSLNATQIIPELTYKPLSLQSFRTSTAFFTIRDAHLAPITPPRHSSSWFTFGHVLFLICTTISAGLLICIIVLMWKFYSLPRYEYVAEDDPSHSINNSDSSSDYLSARRRVHTVCVENVSQFGRPTESIVFDDDSTMSTRSPSTLVPVDFANDSYLYQHFIQSEANARTHQAFLGTQSRNIPLGGVTLPDEE